MLVVVYDGFYSLNSHQHVSAAIAAVFGLIKMIQFLRLIPLGCPSRGANVLVLRNGVLGRPNCSTAGKELRKRNVTCDCGTYGVSGELTTAAAAGKSVQ